MERYSEYKDSGVKWLGKIPSHWEVRKIIGSFSENKKKNTNFTFTRAMQFNYGTIVDKNEGFDTTEAKSIYCNYALINRGDIVINGLNLNYDFISQRVAISPKDGIITSAYVIVSPRENMNPYYFCYLFKDMDNMKMFHGMGTGVRKTLSFKELRNQLIPIPTLEEQDAIVRYLDAATSKIDKAIAMQQKMIDLLNERKQIIIQNAVTKGLDENVEMKDSGVEWTEFFPNSWSIKKVKYIFEFISTKEVTSNRTFYIALENIVAHSGNYIDTNSEYESAGISFQENDILFGKLRPYLAKVYLCECKGIALGDIFVLRPKSGFDSRFLRYLLISDRFIKYVDSSTYGAKMPRTNWGFMGNICISYPNLDEQKKIANYLDKQMQRFDSAISNCQRQITLLQERKQIIINEVVTGKVKVL